MRLKLFLVSLLSLFQTNSLFAMDGKLGEVSKASTEISITIPERIAVSPKKETSPSNHNDHSCSRATPQDCLDVFMNTPYEVEKVSVISSSTNSLVLIIEPEL